MAVWLRFSNCCALQVRWRADSRTKAGTRYMQPEPSSATKRTTRPRSRNPQQIFIVGTMSTTLEVRYDATLTCLRKATTWQAEGLLQ